MLSSGIAEPPVNVDVIAGHPQCSESRLELATARVAGQRIDLLDRTYRVRDVVTDEPGPPVLDDFGYRSAAVRDHRRAARHGLDHHEAERLGPVDRKHERPRATEERLLLVLPDLADDLHMPLLQER